MDSGAAERKRVKDAKRAENRKKHREMRAAEVKEHKPVTTKQGSKTRMQQLREKLLSTGNSETVLRKLMEVVKNDEHPGQMQAVKICMDRMLPTSMFEDKSVGTPVISITFGSVGDDQPVVVEGEVIDNDIEER